MASSALRVRGHNRASIITLVVTHMPSVTPTSSHPNNSNTLLRQSSPLRASIRRSRKLAQPQCNWCPAFELNMSMPGPEGNSHLLPRGSVQRCSMAELWCRADIRTVWRLTPRSRVTQRRRSSVNKFSHRRYLRDL